MPLVPGAAPAERGSVGQLPEQPAPEAAPSFLDVAAAAERTSNLAGTLYDRLTSPKPDAKAAPGFDPVAHIPEGYEAFGERFLDAQSPEEIAWMKGRINSELNDRRVLERAGWGGFGASLAAGFTDPLTLASMAIPGGGETRLAQAVRLGITNVGVSAAQEAAMHQLTVTRTAQESAFNVAGSALLGGILGAAIRPHVPRPVMDEAGETLSRELHNPSGGTAALGPTQRSVIDTSLPSDVAAPLRPEDMREASIHVPPKPEGPTVPRPGNIPAIEPERMSLLQAAAVTKGASAQTHGISLNEAIAQGLDPADLKAARFGARPVFTRGGASFDEMAESLAQHGYPVVDDAGHYSPNSLLDAIDLELRGKPQHSSAAGEYLGQLAAHEEGTARAGQARPGAGYESELERDAAMLEAHAAERGAPAEAPQDTMLREFEKTTAEHPTQPGQRLMNGKVGVELVRDPVHPDVVHIENIRALETGKGHGPEALKALGAMADRHGVTLSLDAVPLEREGISAEKLRALYEQHGFVPAKGGLVEGRAMARPVSSRELRSSGLEGTSKDAQDVAIVQRAARLDEGRVESLAKQHENDRQAFIRAVQEFLAGHTDGHPEAVRGGQARPAAAPARESAGAPAEPTSDTGVVNPYEESTAGAAAVNQGGREELARGARTLAGGPIGRVSPSLRILGGQSVVARRLVQELANIPEFFEKNFRGEATAQPIERKLWGYEGVWWQGLKARGEQYRAYRERMAGLGQDPISRGDFNHEIAFAMRRRDSSPIPEVAKAAAQTRAIVFQPLYDRALKAGLVPEDAKLFADSYLTRQYDAVKIRKNMAQWLDTISAGFRAKGIDSAEARDIAHQVTRSVLGSERGTMDWHIFDDIVPRSGQMKERTLALPDELLEPYLNSDIDHLSHSYLRSMAPEVEFTERFGTRDMKDQFDEVRDDYTRIMERARARGEDIAPISREMDKTVADLGAIRDRLYGIYGQPKDPGSFFVRAGRVLRSDNALRLLGAATLAHFPDVANVIMRYGMPKTFGAIGKLLTSPGAMRLAGDEAKRMGAALDMVTNATVAALGDFGSHSQFAEQRAMAKITRAFTIVTGETPLITMVQSLTSTLAQDTILRAAETTAAGGKISGSLAPKLAAAGLDEAMLRRIAAEGGQHVREVNGLKFGMSDVWADKEASQAFESAVLRDAHGVTLRPGAGDTPLFMSTELGKSILQFKSFAFAANRIVVNPLLQGLSRGDLKAVQGLAALVFMGTASYVAKQRAAGQPIEADNSGRLAMEVLDKSNLMGWTSELIFPGLWALGMKDLSRWSDRDAVETLLGPSAGTVSSLYERRLLSREMPGDDGEGHKPFSRSDLHFLRRLMPGQNLWYFRRAINALEDSVGDAFDLPGKSNAERAEELLAKSQ